MDVSSFSCLPFFQSDFDEIDMSGEAGCFFRDQKRRIGEYNYMVMFSEKSMLVTKMFLIKLTKVNTEFLPLLFFLLAISIAGFPTLNVTTNENVYRELDHMFYYPFLTIRTRDGGAYFKLYGGIDRGGWGGVRLQAS